MRRPLRYSRSLYLSSNWRGVGNLEPIAATVSTPLWGCNAMEAVSKPVADGGDMMIMDLGDEYDRCI